MKPPDPCPSAPRILLSTWDGQQAVARLTAQELDRHWPGQPGNLLGGLSQQSSGQTSAYTVKTIQLSRILQGIEGRVDLLKMDIEGAETEAMLEAHSSRSLKKVDRMFIEYHHHSGDQSGKNFELFCSILREAGFSFQMQADIQRPCEPDRFQDILFFASRSHRDI